MRAVPAVFLPESLRGGRVPRAPRLPRLLVAVLAVTAALLGGAAPATAQPTAQETREHRLVALVNSERARAGLAPLAVSPRLTVLARRQAEHMAARGRLSHSTDLARQIRDWRSLAENVGLGGSADHVHGLLMGSRPHRANILGAGSRRVGIGVTTDRLGRLWVAEVFVQPR